MNLAEPDENVRVAVSAASDQFDAACKARDEAFPDRRGNAGDPTYDALQAQVTAAYDAMNAADTNYFRLNIWGMQIARELMYERGMLVTGYNHPAWPDPADFGYTPQDDLDGDEETYRYGDVPRDEWPERLRRYRDAIDEVYAFAVEVPGIMDWKLGSNDNWLITPIECMGALARLEVWAIDQGSTIEAAMLETPSWTDRHPWAGEPTGPQEVGWWPEWLAWIARAARHGGFIQG